MELVQNFHSEVCERVAGFGLLSFNFTNCLLFNQLSSMYELKPPISKAKMGQITKSGIKGLKMYKHIVQSVERFIAKVCCDSKSKLKLQLTTFLPID